MDAGAAILIPESKMQVDSLSAQLQMILTNPDGALKMSQAALGFARPDATDTLVEMVEVLSMKGKKQ